MRVELLAFGLLFIVFSYPQFGCKETPPGPSSSTIELAVTDASCTEAWLKVTLTDASEPRTVALKRDGQTVLSARLTTSDSVLIDEGLLPHHTYTYQALRLRDDGVAFSTSDAIQVTTLDTTSHDFTFQIDTLGDGNGSVLYDVAIINDTLAYAVGEIYKRDSLGNWDPIFYNLAKWNGREWTLQRLYYQGNTIMHLRWILAFNERDIWVNSITHWNGVRWEEVAFDPIFYGVSTNKAWGTSSSDFYVVGNGGFIAHYDRVRWRRIESGTTIDLRDVWGSPDGSVVWAGGYTADYTRSILLQSSGQQWRRVIEIPLSVPPRADSISGSIASVWASMSRRAEVATSGGMYQVPLESNGNARRAWFPSIGTAGFFNRVRGKVLNNMFVVGDFGTVAHYSGVSWHQYTEFFNMSNPPSLRFWSVSVSDCLMLAVGTVGGRAFIVRGQR